MAVTPTEARAFTTEENEFLYQFERSVDYFIRQTGLVAGESTLTYDISGQERKSLNTKTMNEITRRYNDAGWNASFTIVGPNPHDFVLTDPK